MEKNIQINIDQKNESEEDLMARALQVANQIIERKQSILSVSKMAKTSAMFEELQNKVKKLELKVEALELEKDAQKQFSLIPEFKESKPKRRQPQKKKCKIVLADCGETVAFCESIAAALRYLGQKPTGGKSWELQYHIFADKYRIVLI